MKHGSPFVIPVRQLYAHQTLGLDGYLQSQERIKMQFNNMTDKFKAKMTDYVTESPSKNMIFTEDLKNMIHLAENTESDIQLVINMMKKFNTQNKEMRFGNFVFGPVVMRMFYTLNEPDKALECFKSDELTGFFDQLMSYQLLLDLLYENCKYDEVMETFQIIKSKQIQGTKYPKNVIVLTMAACYKRNSKESLDYALLLWTELNSVGHQPMRRAATFCAALAANQGKPEAALEIVSTVKKQSYMTVRNIKLLALSQLNRMEEVLKILKSVAEFDDPNNIKHTISKDVIDNIWQGVEKITNPSIKQDFQRIEKILAEEGHVIETTLESQLCSEIQPPPMMHSRNDYNGYQGQQRIIPRYEYEQRKSNKYRVVNQRPGLSDMN